MNLQAVANRIGTHFSGRVGVAATTDDAIEISQTLGGFPNVVLTAPRDEATAEATTGGVRQIVASSFGVMVAIKVAGEANGVKRLSALDSALGTIRDSLVGYVTATGEWPIELTGGGLVYAQAGHLLWLDEYRTKRLLGA